MSRGVFLLFGVALLVAGIVFTGLMWRLGGIAREQRSWPKKECLILESAIEISEGAADGKDRFSPRVKYRYEVNGVTHTGTRLRRVESAGSREESVRKRLAPFQAGQTAVCYVNPADPTEAVLIPETMAPIYSLWFPGAFLIFGGGLIWRAARGLMPGQDRSNHS